MINETSYKGRPAISVSGGGICATFLPLDGGKMASLKTFDGVELLEQARTDEYLRLTIDGSYVDAECSAFDDMFPTIDPCVISGRNYLDHGEVCRREFSHKVAGDTLILSAMCEAVNAVFEKEITATDKGIEIKYTIKNLNTEPLPYIWAGHMMFAARSGARVFSNIPPESEKRVMFGNVPSCPENIGEYSQSGESYKYYMMMPTSSLLCGIDYGKGEKIEISFAGEIVRWLGVWMNNGSFKGMYNIALEPCTAPLDSPENADREGKGSVIFSESEIEFTMWIRYTNDNF